MRSDQLVVYCIMLFSYQMDHRLYFLLKFWASIECLLWNILTIISNLSISIQFSCLFSSKLCTHPLVFEPNGYEHWSANCSTQWRERSSWSPHCNPCSVAVFWGWGKETAVCLLKDSSCLFAFFWALFEQLFEILKGEGVRLLQPSAPPVAASYGRTSNPSSCLIHWLDVSCHFSYKTTFGGLFSCAVRQGSGDCEWAVLSSWIYFYRATRRHLYWCLK